MKKPPQDPVSTDADATPDNPQRRRLLGGLALAGGALAIGPGEALAEAARRAPQSPLSASDLDKQLREKIQHVVVIYAENRSFNNLFPDFPGLQRPLSAVTPAQARQVDRDGSVLDILPPIWGGLAPDEQVVDHRRYKIGEDAIGPLPNAPFPLRTADGKPLPHGVVTRDLVHRFYENQMQINGGRNDGFAAWSDAGGLVMGHYADAPATLRLWSLAREYTLCDNFFMGAFGGSFLNHQYLVAAQAPYYPHADTSPARLQISAMASDRPDEIRLAVQEDSPDTALNGKPRFVRNGALTPDFWAVNTLSPPFQPSTSQDPARPDYAAPDSPDTLPAQTHRHIGDALDAKGVDWAWYAGGWGLAVQGKGDTGDTPEFPTSPNFQIHHQPFNYFANLAPGTAARARRLRDGGLGDSAPDNRFIADVQAGELPPVAFYKPQGNLNMHAGYSDVAAGDRHIAMVVDALRNGPLWDKTVVFITFDENGGWWDHVAPPKADRWGPGSRIPALVVSPHARRGHVDHSVYDTGSILRFITRRFGLETLPGLAERERAMQAASGVRPGDLTAALHFA
ncbi:acid phosphatase [Xanthomonas sp. CFBP 8703]|uniref:phospholipase C n=1 Tax=Xanthomonas bonasiae TaxID=2810351 RepID=A0ABS3B0E4_9XANT|nr:acid phosphatase [Xanthomonas bonasiae]